MPRGKGIDQEPMYGGMDRQSVPELKAADEKLIADVSKEFGSRGKASDAFVDQGIRYYQVNNFSMSMKRFNQAWLLSPSNPNVFWGFAMVYHDEGKICKAKEMVDRSLSLNLSKPIALADGGRIYTLCGVSDKTLDEKTKTQYFTKSEDLYKKAIAVSPNNDYIYGSWATAYYWRGDYARSWEMVAKARSLGFTFPGPFMNLLRQKMPEPKE
jgi:tetratricopeptide (TPR) repeat protein